MNRKTLPITIILTVFSAVTVLPQEVITGLQTNRIILNAAKDRHSRKASSALTLSLPFFDDFSAVGIFPDTSLWEDDFVFINNSYPVNQLTTGVATFDAIDNEGRLYESAGSEISSADRLTSQPVNLGYLPSDNIWLSFFVQPGGIGDPPEQSDSLTLNFYSPGNDKWYSVWNSEGGNVSDFRLVMININDPKFLQDGFRFRFTNYVSLSSSASEPSMAGNSDHWNLDYILLDANRSSADTVFRDVAFRYPTRSLLKTHEAIPWNQFNQVFLQEMGSFLPFHYRNNDTITRNVTRFVEILDVYNNTGSFSFTAGAANAGPGQDIDFDAGLVYTYNSTGSDSALFRIKSWLKTDTFDPKANDTVIYFQRFGNYFAFDDGSPEAGYGINGLGSRNAMVAYRFRSFTDDTLRAVNICFNDSYLNANQRSFDLMVWDDNNGIPGNVLYSQEEALVKQGNSINGFNTYQIGVSVPVEGIFYVGWKQRSETFLNAGLDLNTPHKGRQLYWINGSWNTSQAEGSLMIRPVTGAPLQTGISDIRPNDLSRLRFWPNPATLSITLPDDPQRNQGSGELSFIDLKGNEVMRLPYSSSVDISQLTKGFYIIIERVNGIPVSYNRLIKL